MIERMGRKPEYTEGPEARKKFDEGMTKLFRAPGRKIESRPSSDRLPCVTALLRSYRIAACASFGLELAVADAVSLAISA
jgi:hypothetical protein